MNTLNDELDEKRRLASGEIIESISIKSTASISGLLLVKMNRKLYSLAWTQYAGAEYFPAEDGTLERIEMRFLHQAVTLHGCNLAALMEDITEMHVARVPELPERYLETDYVRDMGEAIVTRIDVAAC